MAARILNLIDFEKVDPLLEGFNQSTGFVTAILDLHGNVLSKSGWRPICTEFHQINPETSKQCTFSNTVLANKMAEGEKYHFYQCLNGLVDVAVPIVIKGEHIANLFSGQFFFEKPNLTFFKKQAEKYGFEENSYLTAIEEVPVISKEKVLIAMDFLLNMTQLISETSWQKMEQMELTEAFRNSEKYNRTLFTDSPTGIALAKTDGSLVDANPAYCTIIGRTLEETLRLTYWEITPDKYKEQEDIQLDKLHKKGYYGPYEKEYIHLDGHLVPVRLQGKIIEKDGEKLILSSVEDITERILTEKHNKRLNRVYTVLSNINKTIVHTRDTQVLYDEVCQIAVVNGGFLMSWIGMVNPITNKVEVMASSGKTGDYLDTINIDLNDKRLSSGPTGMAIKTGKAVFSNNIGTDDKMIPWRKKALHYGYHSSITLPFTLSGKVSGAFTMYSGETNFFTEDEIQLLNEIASNISFALEFIESEKEKRLAEEESEKNRVLLQSIIEGTHDAIYIKDTQGKYLLFNHSAELFTGKKAVAVIGKDDKFLFSEEEALIVMAGDQKVMNGGDVLTYEEFVTTADGQKRTFLSTKGPILDKEGKPVGLFGLARDITERKKAQEELREREYLLSASQQAAHVGTWSWKVGDTKVFWSDETYRIYGLNPEMGPPDFEFFFGLLHPEDRLKMRDWALAVEAGMHPSAVEFRVMLPEGVYRVIRTNGDIIETKDGAATRIAGTAYDITERKKAEEALLAKHELFRKTFNISPLSSVLTKLPERTIVEVNPAFEKLFGYSAAEVIGTPVNELVLWTDPFEQERVAQLLLKNGKVHDLEFEFRTKSGQTGYGVFYSEVIEQLDEVYVLTKVMDITGRKLAEQKLRINEIRLKKGQEIGHFGYWQQDIGSDAVWASAEAMKIYGFTPIAGELSRNTIAACIRDVELVRQAAVDLITGNKTYNIEFEIDPADGSPTKIISEIAELERDMDGVPVRILGVLQDITNRKLAEEQLRLSEEKFSNAFHVGPAGLTITRIADGKFLDVNDSFLRMFEYNREEVIGHTSLEINMLTSEARATLIKAQLETGGLHNAELLSYSKSGKPVNLLFSSKPITIDGEACHVTTMIDVSDRKQAEKALQESEEKYRSIYENSSVAILLTSTDGSILSANEFACQLFERTEKEICEAGRRGLLDLSDPRLPAMLEERKKTGKAKGELYFLKKNGTKFPGEISSVVFTDQEGNERTSMVIRDMTEQKLAEEEVKALNQTLEHRVTERTIQLEAANKELESFSYSISHDLRAPLRAIYGFSQILANRHRGALNDEGKQYMDYIVSASVRMEQLINDLQNYARLGRKSLEMRPVSLQNIFNSVHADLEAELVNADGEFLTIGQLPILTGDETLLRQIVINLVGNAIKYRRTDIQLKISMSCEQTNEEYLIKITDNGIGIPKEHWEKIFNVFQRLHGEDKYPGTGIGLANVKKAVNLLGGTVRVESAVGVGSTFFMTFPNTIKSISHE